MKKRPRSMLGCRESSTRGARQESNYMRCPRALQCSCAKVVFQMTLGCLDRHGRREEEVELHVAAKLRLRERSQMLKCTKSSGKKEMKPDGHLVGDVHGHGRHACDCVMQAATVWRSEVKFWIDVEAKRRRMSSRTCNTSFRAAVIDLGKLSILTRP